MLNLFVLVMKLYSWGQIDCTPEQDKLSMLSLYGQVMFLLFLSTFNGYAKCFRNIELVLE